MFKSWIKATCNGGKLAHIALNKHAHTTYRHRPTTQKKLHFCCGIWTGAVYIWLWFYHYWSISIIFCTIVTNSEWYTAYICLERWGITPLPSCPFLSFPFVSTPSSFSSPPLHSFPFPLEVGPLIQLGDWGSAVSLPSGVRGGDPAANAFKHLQMSLSLCGYSTCVNGNSLHDDCWANECQTSLCRQQQTSVTRWIAMHRWPCAYWYTQNIPHLKAYARAATLEMCGVSVSEKTAVLIVTEVCWNRGIPSSGIDDQYTMS